MLASVYYLSIYLPNHILVQLALGMVVLLIIIKAGLLVYESIPFIS